ncbi:Hypothetical protein R9X50_00569600 [Acrodontium crateriforme]|uniref:Succinate dehydrogenase assembly factor 4, mitochondrial n=1 Tax=Acrodontium crateriforme TaxID=150365 RepID=A0AAQ3M9U4_9PEZI|nr:Hypothetical protein R9X50_00569600 [Acrodontium crateriforme]
MQASHRFISRTGFFVPRRTFTASTCAPVGWRPGPAPPRLPKEEQEIFEKLQHQSTGAFSTPRAEEPAPMEESSPAATGARSEAGNDMLEQLRERARVAAKGDGEELHPNVRRGAPPEFEGEKNPKTGEVGGPKNEPLRWGVSGDWSYNGRVTDF